MPFKITILWGSAAWREPDDEPVDYHFKTEAEMNAFMDGVRAMDGWTAYEVIDETEGVDDEQE